VHVSITSGPVSLSEAIDFWNLRPRTPLAFIGLLALKVLTTSVALAYIAEYATVVYAVRNGFRAPVEGVNYLSLAVGTASFGVSVLSVFIFGTLGAFGYLMNRLLFRPAVLLARRLDRGVPGANSTRWLKDVLTQTLGSTVSIVASFLCFVCAMAAFLLPEKNLFGQWPVRLVHLVDRVLTVDGTIIGRLGPDATYWSAILVFAVLSFTTASGWALHRRQPILYTQLIAVFYVFLSIGSALFVPTAYENFLRMTRLGGGIEVIVATSDEIRIGGAHRITLRDNKIHLLLYTKTHIVIWHAETGHVVEIPVASVQSVAYPDTRQPLWRLPNR